jgi:putative membrane protein
MVPLYAGAMDTQPFPFPGGGGGRVLVERAGDAGGWPDGLSWVMFAILLVLLLIAIVSFALALYDRSHRAAPTQSGALAELDLRYARGEIGRDEYVQRRADLGGIAPPASEATTVVSPQPPEPQPT